MKHIISLVHFLRFIRLPVLSILLFVFGIYGCAQSKVGSSAADRYIDNPFTAVISRNFSPEVVENVMVETLVNQQWVIQSGSQSQVNARLKHRAYEATVTLKSDGSIITILNQAT